MLDIALLIFLATTLVTLAACRIVYNLFFSPLRHVPGPLVGQLLGVFGLFIITSRRGQIHVMMAKLHAKYGLNVRVAPNVISFSSPTALKQIYAASVSTDFPKGPLYDIFLFPGDSHNMLTTPSIPEHAYLRRLMSPAFGIKYLEKLEPLIQEVVLAAFAKIDLTLKQESEKDERLEEKLVDIWKMSQAVAFDVIGSTAFGSSFHMIERGSHQLVDYFKQNFVFISLRSLVNPLILPLFPIYYNAKVIFTLREHHVQEGNAYAVAFVDEIIKARKASKGPRVDLLQMLIDAKDTEGTGDGLSDENISHHARLFLAAGSETTSNSMGYLLIRLCKEAKYRNKLVAELDECEVGEDGLIKFEQLKGLVWFDAIIKESLRMNPVVSGGMFRVAAKDCVIDGIPVPRGTSLLNPMGYQHNAHPLWGDSNVFRPERFLSAEQCGKNEETARRDREAVEGLFMPFSVGSRNCIGRTFAYMVFVGNLLKRYEIDDVQGQSVDEAMYITLGLVSGTYKVSLVKR